MQKNIQQKIAVSRYTLPFVLVYAAIIWLLSGLISMQLWLVFVPILAATFVMTEIDNRHTLTRTYSRTISASFILLNLMVLPLFHSFPHSLTQLCFVASIFTLFYSYQNKFGTSNIYISFTLLGILSLFSIHILWLLPMLWISMRVHLLSFSNRTFWASILGFLTPYWILLGYYTYNDCFNVGIAHLMQLFRLSEPFHFEHLTMLQTVSLGYMTVLLAIGSGHFWFNRSQDKMRTRLLYYMFMMLSIVLLLIIIVQPALYNDMVPMLIATISPLIGHFITFTGSRISMITCIILLLINMAITVLQLIY